MPMFHFKAMTAQGAVKEGSESAASYSELLARLRQRHYFPLDITEVVTGKDLGTLPIFGGRVGVKRLAVFCRQFAVMLGAGVTIVGCLDILRQQTQHKRLRDAAAELYEDVQKGLMLSESLRKRGDIFPNLMIQMVEAGETSGSLDLVMSRVAVHYEKENKINARVKSAMVYPSVLAVVCVCVVIFLLTSVMPTFVGMFQGSDIALPGPTMALLAISEALRTRWYLFALFVGLAVYIFRRYAGTDGGRMALDRLKLRLPVVKGLVQKTASARFARTMSTMLASGIPLLKAMEDTAGAVGNAAVAKGILDARESVRKGAPLSAPIRKLGFFPPMVPSMIEIGEESGTLEEVLDKTAGIYDEEVDIEVSRMLSLMEPLMIVVMALIVGFIVIAMMLPMFGMLQTV
ncbi:MAG TPA: type II secretion system F family protein [Terriglobales bacterium]|nr:type II secretion system F family protein [Terriglobales bacterium]